MSKQTEALKLALEALITASGHVNNEAFVKVMMARDALVEALAEQTAPMIRGDIRDGLVDDEPAQQQEPWPEEPAGHIAGGVQPAQPSKPWAGLTDEEKRQLFDREDYQGWLDYINAIEAKLKEKNT